MRRFPVVVGPKNIPRLRDRMLSIALRRTADDLEWETPQVSSVLYWIDLNTEQRKAYKALQAEKGNVLGRIVRASMLALGVDAEGRAMKGSPKTTELIRLLAEGGEMAHEKVLVFTQSRKYIDHLVVALKAAGIGQVAWIHGGVQTQQREVIRESFQDGATRILLLDAAGEHALNLQAAPVAINLDLPWNPARLQQRVGRLRPYLGGADRLIRVVTILARDTIEERVVEKVVEKVGLFSKVWGESSVDLTGVFTKGNLETML